MSPFYMLVIALLIIAEMIAVGFFIIKGWPQRSNLSTLLKCTGSLIFILTAVVSVFFAGGFTTVAWIMLAGFCLSLIGDFWLDLKITDKHIFMGILFFFLAHVSYILAFIKVCQRELGLEAPFSKWEMIAIAVIFVVAAAGSFIVKMDMRKLFIPVAIYSFTICTMVVKSFVMCYNLFQEGVGSAGYLVTLAVGALLFITSDIVLAFMYFRGCYTKKMRVVNLVTYFAGQMLMAISVPLLVL